MSWHFENAVQGEARAEAGAGAEAGADAGAGAGILCLYDIL